MGFELKRWASGLFGVFSEPPSAVVWRFSPAAAADARAFEFHPSQKMIDLPDGSLEVRLRAGGLLEMAHHLMTWRAAVQVVQPARLRNILASLRRG